MPAGIQDRVKNNSRSEPHNIGRPPKQRPQRHAADDVARVTAHGKTEYGAEQQIGRRDKHGQVEYQPQHGSQQPHPQQHIPHGTLPRGRRAGRRGARKFRGSRVCRLLLLPLHQLVQRDTEQPGQRDQPVQVRQAAVRFPFAHRLPGYVHPPGQLPL